MTKLTKKDEMKNAIMAFLNDQVGSVSRKAINEVVGEMGSARTISRALGELKAAGLVLQQKDGTSFSWVSTEPKEKKKEVKTVEKKTDKKKSGAVDLPKETKKKTNKGEREKARKNKKADKPQVTPEGKRHDLSKLDNDFISGLIDTILSKDKKKPTKKNIAAVRTMLETTNFLDKLKADAKKKAEKKNKVLTKENVVEAGKVNRNTPASTGKKPEKEKKKKAPGVIATIAKAISKKARTKKQILKVLVKAFPERDPEKMMKTINVQVPSRLRKDKGLNIEKGANGYLIMDAKK